MHFTTSLSNYRRKISPFLFVRSNEFSPLINPPHAHEGVEILIMLSGSADFHIEGSTYPVESGDIVIANENETHFFNLNQTEFDRVVIGLNNDFFRSNDFIRYSYIFFGRQPGKNCHIRAAMLNKYKVFEILNRLEKYVSDETIPESVIMACFTEFFYFFEKAYKDSNSSLHVNNELTSKVLDYINSNLSENIKLETIAKHFFVTEQYLCRVFKKSLGITINDYITKNRMNLYFDFLKSGYNIQTACEKAGFGSYSAFFRAYKKLYGKSPKKDIRN